MLHLSRIPDGLHKPLTVLDALLLLLHLVSKFVLSLLCRTTAPAEDPQSSFRLSQHRCEQAK